MAIITMLKAIKEVHSKSVVLIKIGGFYHAYGKDAYILSYFLGYKIKKIEGGCANCGFPIYKFLDINYFSFSTIITK